MSATSPDDLVHTLLSWYDRNRRTLPWRALPGERADPYRVWLSEIMLQQTTVQAVAPYFQAFIDRWPDVHALAAAPVEDVMQAWAGLGYYARARNLHRCAQVVAQWRGGKFPDEEADLRQLPGVGDYTAAAIAAIAYGKPAIVVDGNVERVIARMFAHTKPLPAAKPTLKHLASGLSPAQRPGDYAQAMMDLGATICTPRSPACGICPWIADCQARRLGIEATLPAKADKPERPVRKGIAFWTIHRDGSILLRRRPPEGLLGGMMEIPSTSWRSETWQMADAVAEAPLDTDWRLLPGYIRHTFSHFHLELAVAVGRAGPRASARGIWCSVERLAEQALPTVMRKVIRHALAKGY